MKSSLLRLMPFILFFLFQPLSAVEPFKTYSNPRFN